MTSGVKYDAGKVDLTILPWIVLAKIARVSMYGAAKYARYGWKDVPEAFDRYTMAMLRHYERENSGETHDLGDETQRGSGFPHTWLVAWNAMIRLWHCPLERISEEEISRRRKAAGIDR